MFIQLNGNWWLLRKMVVADADVRIVNTDTALIDAALAAQATLYGLSGAYMIASTGSIPNQTIVAAVQIK